jgi:SARP family transcriptional regulator, regulator of embCAB operon
MEIRVLGELEVLDRGRRAGPSDLGGRKPKQLLEMLAVARGQLVPKDKLVEHLWGDEPPRHPMAALENHVWILRRHLVGAATAEDSVVVAESGGYRLAVERSTLDLLRFDELLLAANGASLTDARPYLAEALALVRGELIADEPYAEWAAPLRETYRMRVTGLQLDVAEAALEAGDPEGAIEHAGRVLDDEPLSERACRLKMLGLAGRGERIRALALFEDFSETLRTELGIEPLAQTRSVYEELRAGASNRMPRLHDLGPIPGDVGRPRVGLVVPAATMPAPQQEPALVGRAAELRSLAEEIWPTEEGGFRLALVEGLAHTGKSGLVRATLRRNPQGLQGWARFAIPSRELPYLPLFAALRDALGSSEVLPQAELAGARLEVLSEAVRRYAPLVLVLDDLHRTDVHAVRALSNLQLSCADVPVVIIGIIRSEELRYDHPLRSLSPTYHLHLAPVRAEALDPIGGAAAYVRTGGYGAYLAAWCVGHRTGPPDAELLTAVLGRCQAAGPRAHRILTVAAALPEPLSPAVVAAAIGLPVHQVAEHLDRLTVRGLLRDLGPGGYAFAASLVSDALRSQVSQPRRDLRCARARTTSTPLVVDQTS